jgi:hypothetical protein
MLHHALDSVVEVLLVLVIIIVVVVESDTFQRSV